MDYGPSRHEERQIPRTFADLIGPNACSFEAGGGLSNLRATDARGWKIGASGVSKKIANILSINLYYICIIMYISVYELCLKYSSDYIKLII